MFKFKKVISLVLIGIMVFAMSTSVFAVETDEEDYAPIIGDFRYDPHMAALVRQKENIAELYYNAKITGNLSKAKMYLQQFGQVCNETTRAINQNAVSAKAKAKRLSIYQVPQEANNWCGYAAMKSLLDYEGVEKTQEEIAEAVYSKNIGCPWYLSHGEDKEQFPAAVKLTEWTGFNYVPFPYGTAGATDIEASDITERVISTIDNKHGLMASGESRGDINKHSSILPGYPNRKIGHWVAIDGYKSDGDTIYIVDPAKSKVVEWSDDIDAYYSIKADKLAAFVQPRGLIW